MNKKVKKYLKENEIEVLPEYQKIYEEILLSYGVKSNSSFMELMTVYADEFSGSEGTMINVADDLSNVESSYILSLNLDKKYFQLLTAEYDDYLLYNIENDSVILIEGMNDKKLQSGDYDRIWKCFDDFLIDFFEID
jgi:hypothetical protein